MAFVKIGDRPLKVGDVEVTRIRNGLYRLVGPLGSETCGVHRIGVLVFGDRQLPPTYRYALRVTLQKLNGRHGEPKHVHAFPPPRVLKLMKW